MGDREKSFGERLHDGRRLRSDDFGEEEDDEFVTYPNEDELDKEEEEENGI